MKLFGKGKTTPVKNKRSNTTKSKSTKKRGVSTSQTSQIETTAEQLQRLQGKKVNAVQTASSHNKDTVQNIFDEVKKINAQSDVDFDDTKSIRGKRIDVQLDSIYKEVIRTKKVVTMQNDTLESLLIKRMGKLDSNFIKMRDTDDLIVSKLDEVKKGQKAIQDETDTVFNKLKKRLDKLAFGTDEEAFSAIWDLLGGAALTGYIKKKIFGETAKQVGKTATKQAAKQAEKGFLKATAKQIEKSVAKAIEKSGIKQAAKAVSKKTAELATKAGLKATAKNVTKQTAEAVAKVAEKTGIKQAIKSVSKSGVKETAKAVATSVEKSFTKKVSKPLLKKVAELSPKIAEVAGKAPVANAVVEAGFSAYKYGTANTDKERKEAVGEGIGGTIGGALGFAATSWIPIPGARVAGTMIGSVIGNWVGAKASEWFADPDDLVPDEYKELPKDKLILAIEDAVAYSVAKNRNYFTGKPFEDEEDRLDYVRNLTVYKEQLVKEVRLQNLKKTEVKVMQNSGIVTPADVTATVASVKLPPELEKTEVESATKNRHTGTVDKKGGLINDMVNVSEEKEAIWVDGKMYTFKQLIDRGYLKPNTLFNKPGHLFEKYKYLRNLDNWYVLGGLPEFIRMGAKGQLGALKKSDESENTSLLKRLAKWLGLPMGYEQSDMETVKGLIESSLGGGGGVIAGGSNSALNAKPPKYEGLGSLSRKHESNGNPATVSSGRGDYGGVSYGMYQFASNNGSVQRFLENTKWGDYFKGMRVNSPQFKAMWRKLGTDPKTKDEFAKSQHEYVRTKYYDVAIKEVKDNLGVDLSNRSKTLQDVIWSTAVQHGEGKVDYIIKKALKRTGKKSLKDVSDRELIAAIYAERGKTDWLGRLAYFKSSSWKVQQGVAERLRNEASEALKMLTLEEQGKLEKPKASNVQGQFRPQKEGESNFDYAMAKKDYEDKQLIKTLDRMKKEGKLKNAKMMEPFRPQKEGENDVDYINAKIAYVNQWLQTNFGTTDKLELEKNPNFGKIVDGVYVPPAVLKEVEKVKQTSTKVITNQKTSQIKPVEVKQSWDMGNISESGKSGSKSQAGITKDAIQSMINESMEDMIKRVTGMNDVVLKGIQDLKQSISRNKPTINIPKQDTLLDSLVYGNGTKG